MTDLIDEIRDLKTRHNATILAHYYQDGEIQDLADFTGDSLKLAREATKVTNPTIVFCGVHFMAETAKILNPDKRVLLPDLQAGCSLADSCPAEQAGSLSGDAPHQRPTLPDRHLHQQHRRRQGPVRLGRHLRQRRGDHPPRAGGSTRSCSCRIAISASICKKSRDER